MAPSPSMAGKTRARCLPVMPTQAVPDGRLDRARNPYGSPRKSHSFYGGTESSNPLSSSGFAKAEPPACSDLEVDPVRPQCAPGGDPAIGGDHHAVDEEGTAEPVEADAQIRLLHDQKRGVAAADSQEIGAAEEHGVVAE